MHWRPDPLDPDKHERLYAETYTSDAMIQTQTEVDDIPREEGDTRECIALGLMLASDSAQLTSFGSASVWPVYLMFANQSKQERVKPSCHAVHHLAYVPSLGGDFASRYQEKTEQAPSPAIEVHCKRELMHAVWNHLLDDDFIEGSTNGLVIRCSDGVERVFFIRIITYSADYPEKLRTNNNRRCQNVEQAHKLMFEKGLAIPSKQVQQRLGGHSRIPTRNAFSDVLSKVGQDYHNLFVVDLLHEFEIGVWKSVLTHLIRMLYAIPGVGRDRIAILDGSVPTFGRDTIRKFPGNISGLSKLAARDYEDILQCAIPAFDGLFLEEDNRRISELLFLLATWHAYAKLRLHTDTTLDMFEAVGAALCQALRYFATVTCPRYTTKELQRELNARATRQRERARRNKGPETTQRRTVKAKRFNMSTFKLHCIPDYVPAIRKYGTTDSYSTQTSELAHRLSKMWYRSSNRNRGFIGQITSKESRTRFYAAMLAELEKGQNPPNSETRPQSPQPPRPEDGDDAPSNPSERYWMSKSSATVRDLTEWLIDNRNDPALHAFKQEFRPRLIDHLYSRIKGRPYDGDEHTFSDQDRDNLIIEKDRMYEHKTIRFRSTTYDAHRMEESANPRTHADVLVLSHEDGSEGQPAFPYWHARIVGIYRFMVRERIEGGTGLSPASQMDVLFVRWFGFDSPDGQSGWGARQLHKVGFLPDTNLQGPAFGFLDPNEVIRMVHLIPDFASVRTKELLTGPSIAARDAHPDGEYPVYYVAMFSDRDLFMRYRGGGVGHLATRQSNGVLLADKHTHTPLSETQDTGEIEPVGDQSTDSESEGEAIDKGNEDEPEPEDDEHMAGATNDVDLVTAAGFAVL
ncbi:hypothetical protein EDB85DRAFT_2141171 [Lactarius pseudohatsudake]|nr:hypothetical protein EDB85DRAFT_2141171 [Lactarius pseudohatsudake]